MNTSATGIGQVHRTATEQLCQTFDKVADLCPAEFTDRVASEQAEAADWRARISTVGQVKANRVIVAGSVGPSGSAIPNLLLHGEIRVVSIVSRPRPSVHRRRAVGGLTLGPDDG
ncbi:MAG: hypothetical protein AAGJ28_14570 [Pseudomonadota bacterium]